MQKHGAGAAVAECLGVVSLLAVLFGYLCAMGGCWISGVGIFLMPITIAAYLLFTWLSKTRSAKKGYWIMYAVKIAFMIGLFLLAPAISNIVARLVNG